jgi:hypothetical protein
VLPKEIYKGVNELLTLAGIKVYFIEQTPPIDQVKNYDGFVSWDIDNSKTLHHSEGLAYGNTSLIINFELTVYVYARTIELRSSIQNSINNVLQPKVSNKRTHLVGYQLPINSNVFVRHIVHSDTIEFPVGKTASSTAEMSASVLSFTCSFSVNQNEV